eukprot:gene4377-5383_t
MWSFEISWILMDDGFGTVVANASGYNDSSTYTHVFCLVDTRQYTFTAFDLYQDGWHDASLSIRRWDGCYILEDFTIAALPPLPFWSDASSYGVSSTLNSISIINDAEGWVVGEFDTILHTVDRSLRLRGTEVKEVNSCQGKSWTFHGSGLAEPCAGCERYHWRGVSFRDHNTGWVVGDFGRVLRTNNGGVAKKERAPTF